MALDAKIKKALNDFHKSQPALNIDGLPSGKRGIMLGDIIDNIMEDLIKISAKMDLDVGIADTNYEAAVVENDTTGFLG
jgi:hypothetical protein